MQNELMNNHAKSVNEHKIPIRFVYDLALQRVSKKKSLTFLPNPRMIIYI